MSVQVQRSITSPHLQAILAYWNALRRDRPAPQVADLDPLDIPTKSLPYVLLSDLQSRPFRIRYRLVGTHIATLVGGDFRGRYLDQLRLPADVFTMMRDDYAYVAWACQPVTGTYRWAKNDGDSAIVQYTILPLLEGNKVVRFLGAEHIDDPEYGHLLHAEDLVGVPWRETA